MRAGAEAASALLRTAYRGLVVNIARKYATPGVMMADLMQVGGRVGGGVVVVTPRRGS